MLVNSNRLKVAFGASAVLLAVTALAAPAPKLPPPSDPLTDTEKKSLQVLHRNTVTIFIESPGFGMRRMPVLPVDDLITDPKALKKNAPAKDKGPRIDVTIPAPIVEQPGQKAKETHFAVQDPIGKFRFVTEDRMEMWKVTKVQLVGLVKHKEPAVYLTDKMPDMKEVKDVKTRELDTFEKTALEKIKGGESLNTEKRGKEMRVMGPIYAGQRRVACHDQKGQMLGAFSYQLERVPVEVEKEKSPILPRLP